MKTILQMSVQIVEPIESEVRMTSNEMALMANIAVDMQKNEVNEVLNKIRAEIEQLPTEKCTNCKYIRKLYVPPIHKDIPKDAYVCALFGIDETKMLYGNEEKQVMYLSDAEGMCEMFSPKNKNIILKAESEDE